MEFSLLRRNFSFQRYYTNFLQNQNRLSLGRADHLKKLRDEGLLTHANTNLGTRDAQCISRQANSELASRHEKIPKKQQKLRIHTGRNDVHGGHYCYTDGYVVSQRYKGASLGHKKCLHRK